MSFAAISPSPSELGSVGLSFPALGLGGLNINLLSLDCTAFPEKMLLLSKEAAEAARKRNQRREN